MLLEFMVRNYKSIKQEITLSMIARSNQTGYENRLISFRGQKVLPAAMILGTNGAGKTALLKAVNTMQSILMDSLKVEPEEKIKDIIPFMFDKKTVKEPSGFQITLGIDEIKYIYGFSASQDEVHEEYLYAYYSSRATKILERDFQNFSVNDKLKSRIKQYVSMTRPNMLLLGVAGKLGTDIPENPMKIVYEYITKNINLSTPSVFSKIGKSMLKNDYLQNGRIKSQVLELLNTADFSISDFSIDFEEFELNPALTSAAASEEQQMTMEIIQDLLSTDKSTTVHRIDKNSYTLSIDEESNGTRNYLYMLPVIMDCLDEGSILIVDEIETSLHPLLVKEITSLFNDKEVNKKGAQIIFTTHDVLLLEIEQFRRDQIYFVDKNKLRQETDLYSLADFSPRTKENYLKNYLCGRYGAIPHLLDNMRRE